MTNEERDIITQFIARVAGAPQQSGFAGSVPATTPPALPPIDPEADRLIRDLFQRYPETPYRIAQLAFVQEHALAEAQNRIQQLQAQLQQVAQQTQQQQHSGGFFSGLFGGGRSAPPPQGGPSGAWNQGNPPPGYQQGYVPPPQYPPNYNPGMFQRSGSGFLGSALTTAAGVAGGMVAGNLLMDLFSGNHGYPSGMTPGMVESPWGAPGQGYVDNGSWDQPTDSSGGGWDNSPPDNSGFDNSGGDASGWDNASGGDSSWDDTSGGSDDSLI